jgi:hypothetical protein
MTHFWNKVNQCQLKVKRLENKIILKSWGARKLKNQQSKTFYEIVIIAILFIFPLMFKTDIFHIT